MSGETLASYTADGTMPAFVSVVRAKGNFVDLIVRGAAERKDNVVEFGQTVGVTLTRDQVATLIIQLGENL